MKKILFNNYKYSGGSPQTMLEYAKIAQKDYNVVTIGEIVNNNNIISEYKKNKIRVVNKKSFDILKPFQNIKVFNEYIKILKKEKPNLIVSTTAQNMFFDQILSKVFSIPVIYIIAGGKLPRVIVKTMEQLIQNNLIIVLSKETVKDLGEIITLNNTILTIPNRMTFTESSSKFENYSVKKDNVESLLISRLSEDKIKSIRYVIWVVEKAYISGIPIKLSIIGDGEYLDEILELADRVNKKINEDIIYVLGYKNNTGYFIEKSHIVFGKGRSVLDGVFNEKISFVVNENNEMFKINLKNFEELQNSNFTARSYTDSTPFPEEKFISICQEILDSNIDNIELIQINEFARSKYDIMQVNEKIMRIIEINVNKKVVGFKKMNMIKTVPGLLKFYFTIFRMFIINKFRQGKLNEFL